MNHPVKILMLAAAALCYGGFAVAQTPGYTITDNIKQAGVLTDSQVGELSPAQKQTTVVYYDGLSRPMQAVATQASPAGNDMIQPVVYDALGRQTTSYLPYTDGSGSYTTGAYRSNAISGQASFYNQTGQTIIPVDAEPFSSRVFENTPLQRLLDAGMTGSGFQPSDPPPGGHYKTVSYRPNNSTTDGTILIWTWNGTTYTSGTGATYRNSVLWVTDAKDEDGVETLAFADLQGHTVLKRQVNGSSNLDTYYIYNNAGMVAYIIPPLATNGLSAAGYSLTAVPIVNMVYSFIYDNMGRLIQKTVPAKGTVSIVYDPFNRPLLSQDAVMNGQNQWYYVKYDAKGRAIGTGVYTDAVNTTLALMQSYVNTTVNWTNYFEVRNTTPNSYGGYYTNQAFPTTSISALSWAYFDNYNLTGSINFSYSSQGVADTVTTAPVKGMPTVSMQTTVGSGITTGEWLTKAVFYNKRLYVIQVQSNNALNYTGALTVTDYQTIAPDFTGVPHITKVSKATSSSVTTTIQSNLTYDPNYRVTAVDQYYNGSSTVSHVAAYTYSEAGQLVQKGLGPGSSVAPIQTLNTTYSGTNTVTASQQINLNAATGGGTGFNVPNGSTFYGIISPGNLQTVDYRYNIRGQVMSINNSKLTADGGISCDDPNALFGMNLYYNTNDSYLTTQTYWNGSLAAVKWMAKNASGVDGNERAFVFNYDALNRYNSETYSERATAGTTAFTVTHGWDEWGIAYDANGNIQNLQRNAATQNFGTPTQIDDLVYNHYGNTPDRLETVSDATGNPAGFIGGSGGIYNYDANGNLTNEPYQGINTISYNVLNRTQEMDLAGGGVITYTYNASGALIRKQATIAGVLTQTDYIDGFVYTGNGTTQTLEYAPMPEGRLVGTSLIQEFVITDPQGNARVAFRNNGSGLPAVVQENSYYGYGLVMPGSLVGFSTPPNKNMYNGGSEWQNDTQAANAGVPDYYQTFFRNYDPALGRFVAVDPMAEASASMGVYHYAGDNPIMSNDPMGDKALPCTSCVAAVSGLIDQGLSDANGGGMAWDAEDNARQAEGDFMEALSGNGDVDPNASPQQQTAQQQLEQSQAQIALNNSSSIIGDSFAAASQVYENAVQTGSYGNQIYSSGGSGISLDELRQILKSPNIDVYDNGLRYFTTSYSMSSDDPFPGELPDLNFTEVGHFVSWNSISNLFLNLLNQATSKSNGGDMVGISFNANYVEGLGVGGTITAFAITRGRHKGFYVSATPTLRAGADDGTSFGIFNGYYLGDGSPDPMAFLGNSIDIMSSNIESGFTWFSFSGSGVSWWGMGSSFGPEGGVSIGIGYSIPIYGFPSK